MDPPVSDAILLESGFTGANQTATGKRRRICLEATTLVPFMLFAVQKPRSFLHIASSKLLSDDLYLDLDAGDAISLEQVVGLCERNGGAELIKADSLKAGSFDAIFGKGKAPCQCLARRDNAAATTTTSPTTHSPMSACTPTTSEGEGESDSD